MKNKQIKKGRKGILHFPYFVSRRAIYTQQITISRDMLLVDDSCNSGLSKIWGVALGHHHFNNSYRFAFRIMPKDTIEIYWYAYIGGVSPQKKQNLQRQVPV